MPILTASAACATAPFWGGSSDLYRSAGRPVLVEARTTIGYYHRPLLVDS